MPVQPCVKELIGNCRPIHRCDLKTFRLISETGLLESRHMRKSIAEDPYNVLEKQVKGDLRIYAMMSTYTKGQDVMPLVKWIVDCAKEELARLRHEDTTSRVSATAKSMDEARIFYGWNSTFFQAKEMLNELWNLLPNPLTEPVGRVTAGFRNLFQLSGAAAAVTLFIVILAGAEFAMRFAEASHLEGAEPGVRLAMSYLDDFLASEAARVRSLNMLFEELQARAKQHACNVHAAHPSGIGCPADKALGTDEHVFSIVGPHFGAYYGDIMIVLEQTVMHHPDFNMTPCAGTGFPSGNARIFNNWLKKCDVEEFHRCKLNPGIWGWRSVMASALAHACAQHMKIKFEQVTLREMLVFMCTIDSHCLLEGHLPPMLPLKGYTEKIVMTKNTYDQLSQA